MSEERFASNAGWGRLLSESAGEVKRNLFTTCERLDREQELKKVEKALKAAAKECS